VRGSRLKKCGEEKRGGEYPLEGLRQEINMNKKKRDR